MESRIEIRVANKTHTCSFCKQEINDKDRYIYRTYKNKDEHVNEKICSKCACLLINESFRNRSILKKFERLAKS